MTDQGAASTTMRRLAEALGEGGVLTDDADIAPYGTDWRDLYRNPPLAVLRPRTAEEVAAAVAICAEAGIRIVPQGGNTSMVAGGVPDEPGSRAVLTLARMNAVRDIDRDGLTMIIEAGATLAAARDAAAEAGAMLPLSIAAEGSAMIGGVIATNAGGINTLRFGNMRDLTLGLEVVLPDGRIWHGLRRLRKDNTGYALRHLFAGSEGTLGIITAAALRLVRAPRRQETAFCALPSLEALLDLFGRLRDEDESALYAFEYISGGAMDLLLEQIDGATLPLAEPAPVYALIEVASTRRHDALRETLESVLGEALEAGVISDAVIAESEAQRQTFWTLRENLPESQRLAGASVKNDISVPVAALPALLTRGETALREIVPDARIVAFGHAGDGNVHFNVVQNQGDDPAALMDKAEAIMDCVNEVTAALGGSFAAEHGIGLVKRAAFQRFRDDVERDMMRRIRGALDPDGLLNPGKIFQ